MKTFEAELAKADMPKQKGSKKKCESSKPDNGKQVKKSTEKLTKLRAELEKTRKEKDELTRTLATVTQNTVCRETTSNIMPDQTMNGHELLMNNVSLSCLNIPECTPAAGDTELSKRSYDHWKSVLNASLNLIQATNEFIRIDLFRIKAGSLLLELLDGTTTQSGMPDEKIFPYSNAIARLDAHFGSRAYILSQRSKLASMVQRTGELNIKYVQQVAAAAKLCNYKPDEEFEAISRTITRGSCDSRIRTLAYRVLIDGGSLNELIDQVRIREVELENEADYQRLHQQRPATVATVSRQPTDHGQRRQYEPSRGFNRGKGYSVRGSARYQRPSQSCWRCLSTYHTPESCFHSDKVCRNCNRRGHIARACSTQVKQEPLKRRWTGEEAEPPNKIAVIQKEEKFEEQTEVMEIQNE